MTTSRLERHGGLAVPVLAAVSLILTGCRGSGSNPATTGSGGGSGGGGGSIPSAARFDCSKSGLGLNVTASTQPSAGKWRDTVVITVTCSDASAASSPDGHAYVEWPGGSSDAVVITKGSGTATKAFPTDQHGNTVDVSVAAADGSVVTVTAAMK